MKYLSFDIETAKILPDDFAGNWREHRPLGITCAAFAWLGSDGAIKTMPFCGEDAEGDPTAAMDRLECRDLVYKLQRAVAKGSHILTWNGMGFDFEVLAEESGMHAECAELALHHVDMMFQILCIKGFPLGVDAAAKGLGLGGKTEGMSGALAPKMWANQEYDKVLEYVQQDTRTALEVALAVEQRRAINWISQKGRRNSVVIPQWLTVREALRLPTPNTSWMTDPLSRESIIEWAMETA